MKKTAKYYSENPEANAKKLAYQKEYNKKPEQRKKRSELVQERRDRGIYGKGGKDVSHTKNGTVLKTPSENRGSKSDTLGDVKARGGKKKNK
jgi:hypothetical protein